jgi:hypothetical protein
MDADELRSAILARFLVPEALRDIERTEKEKDDCNTPACHLEVKENTSAFIEEETSTVIEEDDQCSSESSDAAAVLGSEEGGDATEASAREVATGDAPQADALGNFFKAPKRKKVSGNVYKDNRKALAASRQAIRLASVGLSQSRASSPEDGSEEENIAEAVSAEAQNTTYSAVEESSSEDLGLVIAISAVDAACRALEQRQLCPGTDACDAISFDAAWKMALNDSLTQARALSPIVERVLDQIPRSMCNDIGELAYVKEADVHVLRTWLLEGQTRTLASWGVV